jgi:RNA polymerase sporulation-specific sigma factor
LKPEEEEHYVQLWVEQGDPEARNILIERNLRLVAHVMKKYYTVGEDMDDLLSIGTIGLIKAIDSFKFDCGARFATYAAKCIQNEILMYFRSQKKLQGEVSINETIDVDKDGNPLTYIDIISVDDTIADDIDKKISIKKMYSLINRILTSRERQIIIMRFGLDGSDPQTQREIASALNISRSYVSRIEKGALEKLMHYFNV